MCTKVLDNCMKKNIYALLFTFIWATSGNLKLQAQIVITPSTNALQLIQQLTGQGVTILNPTINCQQGAVEGSAVFSNGNTTNLGFSQGVVLTSGSPLNIPNVSTQTSSVLGNNLSDLDLDALSPSASVSRDRCILEFDIIPTGDTLRFRYVFGSEEYPEYVCSNFADVFGFFITGPNPAGGNYNKLNIATVPGTTLPVSINTINSGAPGVGYLANGCQSLAYSSLYVNNATGASIVYDAFTVPLTARVAVVPCQTYRLKLAIADVSDQSFDSGVFLESLTSVLPRVTSFTATPYPNLIEGCHTGGFRFTINQRLNNNFTINYQIGGNATNGVDYNNLPGSIVMPAGDTIVTVNVNPVADGINEGIENIWLYLLNPCTGLRYDSALLVIQDTVQPNIASTRDTICAGENTTLTASGGNSYLWAPAGSLSATVGNTVTATPTVTTTYTVTATVAGCTGRTARTIVVNNPNFTVDAGPNQTICANQTVQLQPIVSAGAGPYTYQWSPTSFMSPSAGNVQNPSVIPLVSTTYTLSVSAANGCRLSDTVRITISGVGPAVTATATPTTICPGQQVQLNFIAQPNFCGKNYLGCTGIERLDSVGTGYNIQTGSPTANPTLYGNFVRSTRFQMLYTASELTSVYGNGGSIRSLAWQVGVFNGNQSLENYTISLKCVPPTTTTLTTWETGMQRVYGPKVFTPLNGTGWNNHDLDTLYDWDGVSGLIVEVCFFNPNTNGSLNNMMVFTNSPNTTIYARGNTDQCSTTPAPIATSQRPKMRMRLCQPDYNNFTIAWTPNSGPNAVSNPAIRNPTANPLSSQTYQVNVTQSGCSGSSFVVVNVDTSVRVNAGTDVSVCPGQSATLTATTTGSPLPGQNFTFEWRALPANTVVGNTASINVSPNTATSYVVALSGGPCVVRDTVLVTIGGLTLTKTVTNITCNGASNGGINIAASGQAPINYNWSANSSTGNVPNAANLAPGTYTVSVTDALGCLGFDTTVITQPSAITFTSQVSNVLCFGESTGSITLNASGGTGALTYTWNGLTGNTNQQTGLAVGQYDFTITDVNNCPVNGSATITEPTQLVFNIPQIKDVRCFNGNDGFIVVSPTGGTLPYQYQWSHNAALNQPNALNLTANTYTVTVRDANNCSITAAFSINQPASGLSFNPPTITDITCFGLTNGTATVNPTGGAFPYTYQWTGNVSNSATAGGLSAQTYSITVTDDSLCTATTTVSINQPAQIQITGVVTNATCNGLSNGAIDINVIDAVAPVGYLWSNTDVTEDIAAQPAGGYSVTVTDANNCTQTSSFTINHPDPLLLLPPSITNVSCFGGNNGTITASGTGGTTPYTYIWSPVTSTSATVSNLSAGDFDVTLTDANACTTNATYTVTQPASAVAITSAVVTDVLCNGASTGSIALTVSGGTTAYTYSWSHNQSLNNATAVSLPAASYTATVTDANGCTTTGTYTITQPVAIVFGNSTTTDVSCFGLADGNATVAATGGTGAYTYSWNGLNGTNPQGNLAAGNYTVVVTDANSCTATTSVTINQPGQIVVSLSNTPVSCFNGNNGSATATVNGGTAPYQFAWSGGGNGQTINNLTAGQYTVTVTDNRNCNATAATTVSQPDLLVLATTSTQVSCIGDEDGTITAVANGGTPVYTYTAFRNGTLIASNGTGLFANLQAGSYSVEVRDANNCTAQSTIVVAAPVEDIFTVITDSTSCYGAQYSDGAIRVTGLTIQNMPYQFSVDNGPLQFSGDFYNLKAGIHIITAVNNFGCVTILTAIVPEPLNGIADILPDDTTIAVGQTIQVFSTFTPYSASDINFYSWTPSEGLSCTDCPNPYVTPYGRQNQYTLTINYNKNCVATASITVLVTNNLEIYIPNAFTPNGDGNNDVFLIYGQGIKTVDLTIFNRWGEKVFDSGSQFIGWDGTYKGELQNPGVYSYNAQIYFLDNKTIRKTGSVTLIR